jgi:hypothetical protein
VSKAELAAATAAVTRRRTFVAAERRAPLSWAQECMLEIVTDLQPCTETLNMTFTCRLPLGISEEAVLCALVELVINHEALRTVYVPPPQGPAQHVQGTGELIVEILEVGVDAGPDEAEAACQALARRPFDISNELPLRVALLTRDARPWGLAFAVFHLVIDAFGVDLLQRHLWDRLTRPTATAAGLAGRHQLVDEANWQRSPEGRRQAERALGHHEEALRAMPQTMLPRSLNHDVEPPRFRYLQFTSRALAIAVSVLATRHRVHTAAVLHAGICAVASLVSGLDRAVLQLNFSNRSAPRVRSTIGILTQHPLSWIDLRDASFGDVIARAGIAVIGAQRFGQYPAAEVTAMRRAVELDRGVALDLSCWLNDRRVTASPLWSGEPPSCALLADAADQTRWRPAGSDRASSSSYFVHLEDDADGLQLTVLHDTAILPTAELVAWLRAVESLLCRAVNLDVSISEIDAHVELTRASYGPGWQQVDASWVHLPTTAELVAAAAGRPAAVFPVTSAMGTRLVAYLDGSRGPLDIETLHGACVRALPSVRTAMAPHRYVVCAGAPANPAHDNWVRLPVLAQRTGRPTTTGGTT